ncbi:MAG: DUF5801 repeats-in-toxin domain-containing protein, partial [Alphaproteobacteria bacterium]
ADITDFDGDIDAGTISIVINDGSPDIQDTNPQVGAGLEVLDESDLAHGRNVTVNGTLPVDGGADGLAAITPKDVFTTSAPLSSGGDVVAVVVTADGYIGTINGGTDTVFELTLDPSTGAYSFTQSLPLDHPDTTDPNDVIEIAFCFTATDIDGDTDNGNVVIRIADDGPVAVDDAVTVDDDSTEIGSVINNDDVGEDVAGSITNVNFGGADYPVVAGTPTQITGQYGVLTINSDGTYAYTSNENNPGGIDTFTYTLIDFDGDVDTADLTVTILPDENPEVTDNDPTDIDESNLNGGDVTVTGDVDVDFGGDGPGTITPKDVVTPSVTLTSGGNAIDVVATTNGYVGTINGGADTVFELTLDPATGEYAFTQSLPVDHPDATDPNDVVSIDFCFVATDADGDELPLDITINITDDGPVAVDDARSADDAETITGSVVANDDGGEDVPATITEVAGQSVVAGTPTVVSGTYGTLTLNADGSYSYAAHSNNPGGV